jgi:stage II sporulation protein D
MITKKKLLLINSIDLEEYVGAVLRSETWPGWPLEVNKVFAIVSRSYAMSLIIKARKKNQPYDIKNTNQHQTYKGSYFHKRNNKVLKRAVDETRGMFLSYEGQPILAMFDSCCGGVIPARIDGMIDFNKAPYLERNYACTYCKNCSLFNWRLEYKVNQLSQLLDSELLSMKEIRHIKIGKRDAAGLVKTIIIKCGRKKIVLTGNKFYSLIKDIKSFSFSIAHHLNIVSIEGVGYGHHYGLCQWGARQMVREYWNYRSILQFYYPKTKFMRLI